MNDDQHSHTDVIESDDGSSSPDKAAMVHVRVLQEMARRHAGRIGEIAAQIRAIDSMNVSDDDRALLMHALSRAVRHFEIDAAAEAHYARVLGEPGTLPH